jgi:hypothetical protein
MLVPPQRSPVRRRIMARGSHGEPVFALGKLPRSAPEKRVLAWWLREGTTVSSAWLSERLAMGHYTRVSQAVGQVKREPDRQQKRWQKQLAKVGIGPEPSKD